MLVFPYGILSGMDVRGNHGVVIGRFIRHGLKKDVVFSVNLQLK